MDTNLQVYEIERDSIYFRSRRKLHVYDWGECKCLCGCQAPGSCTLQDVDEKWLTQPDPDEILCKKCKSIALKLIKTTKST